MSHPHFSLEPLSVPEVSSSALVDLAWQAGFDFVSMFAYSPTPQLAADKAVADLDTRHAMQQRMRDTGVKIHNLECFNLTADQDPANFAAALECGGALGATYATAIVYENTHRSDALAKFRRLCSMAAEHRIHVNIEFFAMCKTIPNLNAAVGFLKEAGCRNSGLVMDLLHIVRTSGGMAGLAGFDREMIGTVQISDGPIDRAGIDLEAETVERLIPGTGGFPIKEFCEWLPADVVIGIEVPQLSLFGKTSPLDRARRMIDGTRTLLNSARDVSGPRARR